MERWLGEGIDLAGEAYIQFLEDIYQKNKLYNNELYLEGEHVDITEIDVPILQITGEYDHLIPSESSKPFNEVVGSDDTEIIEYPTGHIGLAVSGSSHRDVWPRVAEWYIEKSTDDPEHLDAVETAVEEATDQIGIEEIDVEIETDVEAIETEAGAIEEAVAEEASEEIEAESVGPAGTEGSDLEEVDGIGPTYAERLRDDGIRTIAELAEADPEDIASFAGVGTARAEDWIQQAKN
jgi:polyhydroxyalkanoate synthase